MDAVQCRAQLAVPWLACLEAAVSKREQFLELVALPGNLGSFLRLARPGWAARALVATWPRQGLHAAAPWADPAVVRKARLGSARRQAAR